MKVDRELLSELTRLGYLQTPGWVASAPANEYAKYREKWRQTLQGNCAILTAMMKKMLVDALREIARGVERL